MTQMNSINAGEIINNAQINNCVLGLQLRAAAYEENQGLSVAQFKQRQNGALGQLLASLKEQGRMSDRAKQVDLLHADLHDAASAIARLIVAGQFDQAIDELATGYYAQAAAALSRALCQFKAEWV